MRVLRGERYKYVHFIALPPLFFDLQGDPRALCNLADDSGYQSRMLEYAGRMRSWRMNHDDRVLANTRLMKSGAEVSKPPRY
jgi:hypothetical protein